jgi:hypothetical protein
VGDQVTILSIEDTFTSPYWRRNASLVRLASVMSDRRSVTASKKPHELLRATVSSSPLASASRYPWIAVAAEASVTVTSSPPLRSAITTTATTAATNATTDDPISATRRPRRGEG